jgi:hypothetical protein
MGLRALTPFVALQLNLRNCYNITDAGLQALVPLVVLH